MKKIVFIIIGLLCAFTASAVSYGVPYRGTGGGIYTTHNYGTSVGSTLAQVPVATMHSTTRALSATQPISTTGTTATGATKHGIYTSASEVQGGVTTDETGGGYKPNVRKSGGSGVPEPCPGCVDENGDFICDVCGHDIYECECGEHCHCNVPLEFGFVEWLFMAAIAGAYALYKVYMGKKSYGDVRNGREMIA